MSDPETVAYFPSAYGEKAPSMSVRMVAHERIGSEVTQELDKGDDGLTMPQWLRERAEHELKIANALYG